MTNYEANEIVRRALSLARSVIADDINEAKSTGKAPSERKVRAEALLQEAILAHGGLSDGK